MSGVKRPSLLRAELGLLAAVVTAVSFLLFGGTWLADLADPMTTGFFFCWLFLIMLWSSFAVVRHADCLAIKLGEPYGTLILTLAVISIEVIMITAVMLTGDNNPTLGRDMMFSVLMIVLNGLVGLSLLLGGLRHVEQAHNLQGANAYLGVLVPLSVVGLILPNYTVSTPAGYMSVTQAVFAIASTFALYLAFLGIQTIRHREYFIAPTGNKVQLEAVDGDSDHHDHGDLDIRSVPFHAAMLVAYMTPIVILSKSLAKIIDYGISVVGAPAALGGFLVAILVLSPEAMAAVQAARRDKLQRSINICLGSGLATIGLTVPAVLIVGMVTGKAVVLGLKPVDSLLLVTTLAVSLVNFSSRRSNYIQGLVHLVLFAAYVVLIFD
jgi:Ca2+:H+ antiporter